MLAGDVQSVKSLQFISLLKQYMERRWVATEPACNVQHASQQDTCWDMSVLRECLADQQQAWAALSPQPMELEPTSRSTPAPPKAASQQQQQQQQQALGMLEQVWRVSLASTAHERTRTALREPAFDVKTRPEM